jgi:molybdenum cofactor biosynthesis enzyme MoaA
MPFVSMRIENVNDQNTMGIRPCCAYNVPNVHFDSIEQYIDSDHLRKLQQHLLTQDSLPPGCEACSSIEQHNQSSIRIKKNLFFNKQQPAHTQIQELDVFISNVCNLSCYMCRPEYSSTLYAERKKISIVQENKNHNFDSTELAIHALQHLPDVKWLALAGGEFFYSKHAERMLAQAQQTGITDLVIISNGSVCNERHLQQLSRVPNLNIKFSVDGTDLIYDMVRYPAQWKQVQQNILRYQSALPHAKIELIMVMQPLVVAGVFDLLKFAQHHNLPVHITNIWESQVNWPLLTDQERSTLSDFLQQGLRQHPVAPEYRMILNSYARHTLPQITHSPEFRLQAVELLAQSLYHRHADLNSVQSVLCLLPSLYQDILDRINTLDETSNINYNR